MIRVLQIRNMNTPAIFFVYAFVIFARLFFKIQACSIVIRTNDVSPMRRGEHCLAFKFLTRHIPIENEKARI